MTINPFNPALHEHLIGLGYHWTHHQGEDIGDAENGPRYCQAYDEYDLPNAKDGSDCVYMSEDGEFYCAELADLDDPLGDWHGRNE